MKKVRLFSILIILSLALSLFACGVDADDGLAGFGPSAGGWASDGDFRLEGGESSDMSSDTGTADDTGADVSDQLSSPPAGMITAAAWDDNDNYSDWLALFSQGEGEESGKFFDYTKSESSWGFDSLRRVKVHVSSSEENVAGARVVALDGDGNRIFSAVSDARGNAYLFVGASEGTLLVTSGEGSATASFTSDARELEVELDGHGEKREVIELMIVLDVTGSMGDEIMFLKSELSDVISKIVAENPSAAVRLALLFYRDTGDKVPFDYYDFEDVTTSDGMEKQQKAINTQYADGGGDYPEAVDEALRLAVEKQWSTEATTKIIFHVLDAPSHSESEHRTKFAAAVNAAAEKGIRICPVICSGAGGLTEYTMRQAAIYTGGTFVFVTDDSGIGGEHHDPQLPNATVELLNSLLVRLVCGYHTGNFADPVYWRQDPGLAEWSANG